MFGGLCFLLNGNMCCGIVGDELMLRVGPEGYDDALSQPGARPMDFTGRPMKGMVYVSAAAIADDVALSAWAGRGVTFAASLPAK
jgi:TfoX/Sxy family transcriptional regulator of competence genes